MLIEVRNRVEPKSWSSSGRTVPAARCPKPGGGPQLDRVSAGQSQYSIGPIVVPFSDYPLGF